MTTDNFISFPEKELNREEPSGVGRPSSERHVLDFRGALVERRAIVSRERLSLSHCLALSALIKLMGELSAM
jgi:nuclear pore complex protein Nup205